MRPSRAAPYFVGDGESFQSYAMAIELWRRVTCLDACKRAPALVFQMEATARDVCLATEAKKLVGRTGAGARHSVLHDYVAPDASDAVTRTWPDF